MTRVTKAIDEDLFALCQMELKKQGIIPNLINNRTYNSHCKPT